MNCRCEKVSDEATLGITDSHSLLVKVAVSAIGIARLRARDDHQHQLDGALRGSASNHALLTRRSS
jgi:hypothetical protein